MREITKEWRQTDRDREIGKETDMQTILTLHCIGMILQTDFCKLA